MRKRKEMHEVLDEIRDKINNEVILEKRQNRFSNDHLKNFIILYLVITIIAIPELYSLIVMIISSFTSLPAMYQEFGDSESLFSIILSSISYGYQLWGDSANNFAIMVGYLVLSIIFISKGKYYWIYCIKEMKESLKDSIKYIIIGVLLLLVSTFGLDLLIKFIINQSGWYDSVTSDIHIPLIELAGKLQINLFSGIVYGFAYVVLIPLVETFVLRKAFFELLLINDKLKIVITSGIIAVTQVLNSFLFSLVLSLCGINLSVDFVIELICLIMLFINAVILSYIYFESNRNIFIVYIINMIANLLVLLGVIIFYL